MYEAKVVIKFVFKFDKVDRLHEISYFSNQ